MDPHRDDAVARVRPGAGVPRVARRRSAHGSLDDPVRAWLDTGTVVSQVAVRSRADAHDAGLWALTLPHHPDVLAAHLQTSLGTWTEDHALDPTTVFSAFALARTPLGD